MKWSRRQWFRALAGLPVVGRLLANPEAEFAAQYRASLRRHLPLEREIFRSQWVTNPARIGYWASDEAIANDALGISREAMRRGTWERDPASCWWTRTS